MGSSQSFDLSTGVLLCLKLLRLRPAPGCSRSSCLHAVLHLLQAFAGFDSKQAGD